MGGPVKSNTFTSKVSDSCTLLNEESGNSFSIIGFLTAIFLFEAG
jgi:hypothetical protein